MAKPREEWKPVTEWSAMCIAAKELRCKSVQMKCLIMYYAINANSRGEFTKPALDICADNGMAERTVRYINAILQDSKVLTITRPVNMSGRASIYKLSLTVLRAAADASQSAVEKTKQLARDKARDRQAKWRKEHQRDTATSNV